MLRARRSRVTSNRIEGKTENSSGRRTCIPTSKMMMESVILKLSRRSRKKRGKGINITIKMPTTPTDIRMSGCFTSEVVGTEVFSCVIVAP